MPDESLDEAQLKNDAVRRLAHARAYGRDLSKGASTLRVHLNAIL
jgi:hypothetical protein